MRDKYSEYSVQDFNRAFEQFYEALTYGKHPAPTSSLEQPVAILLGGQGGAGKSTLHRYFEKQGVISIDGDCFRSAHPNYEIIQKVYGAQAANITQSFANNIANALIQKLSDEGYDLVIEGTCRRADVPIKTCCDLHNQGYWVELAVMCTDKEVAWQSTIDRANQMKTLGVTPREVPKEKFDETVSALPDNISLLYKSGLFDDITLYNRQLDVLYKKSETPKVNPAKIFYHCLHSNSDEHYQPYQGGYPKIALLYADSLDSAKKYLTDNYYDISEGKAIGDSFYQFTCKKTGKILDDVEIYDISDMQEQEQQSDVESDEDDYEMEM